jgi:uncharacterized protein
MERVRSVDPPELTASRPAIARRGLVLPDAVVVAGLALAVLVGRDGDAGWRLARVVAVGTATWGSWIVLRRAGALGRGLVATGAGLVATAVGMGIALPYVTKSGLSMVSLAGLACLASGLVLLVGGAVTTLRALPRWWRIPAAAGLLVAAYAVVFALGVAVAATNVPRTAVGTETPGDRGLTYRDVTFTTTDGVRLSGWYLPSRNGAVVVALHGAGSTRSSVLAHAVVLAHHGYGVLLFDGRGHGRSGGRAMDFGWYGDVDVAAATDFVTAQAGVDPERIAVLGLSMGGEEAVGAAAGDARLRAVVADGATNRVAGDKAWLSARHGVRGWLQEQLDRLMYGTADLLSDASPPITLREAAARTSPRPVLLITAGAVPDEADAAAYIQAASPATVEVWTAPDAGHTRSLAVHPAEWEARVVPFFDRALGLPPGT